MVICIPRPTVEWMYVCTKKYLFCFTKKYLVRVGPTNSKIWLQHVAVIYFVPRKSTWYVQDRQKFAVIYYCSWIDQFLCNSKPCGISTNKWASQIRCASGILQKKSKGFCSFSLTGAQRALTSVQTISAFTHPLLSCFGWFPIYPSSPQPSPSHLETSFTVTLTPSTTPAIKHKRNWK